MDRLSTEHPQSTEGLRLGGLRGRLRGTACRWRRSRFGDSNAQIAIDIRRGYSKICRYLGRALALLFEQMDLCGLR
jgi:hypothetical protein